MTAPEEILRDRLIAALRSVETAAPRLQVPYGAMADAVLDLGDVECRWEVRLGAPDDPAYYRTASREDADAMAAKKGGDVSALLSLRLTPISVNLEDAR